MMYPRPKKKSMFKRFKENFELQTFLETVIFIVIMAILLFLFIWVCYAIKGPTWGYL